LFRKGIRKYSLKNTGERHPENILNCLQYKAILKYSPPTSQKIFCARSNFPDRFKSFQAIANAVTL
jgi:hypothetical protein